MSKSAAVGVRQALGVVKLYGELRDLPANPGIRRHHTADALCKMLGAQVGAVADGLGFVADRHPTMTNPISAGWVRPEGQRIFEQYFRSADHCIDPTIPAMAHLRPKIFTRRREDLVEDRQWYRIAHIQDDRRAAEVDDVLYSVYRRNRSGGIHILAAHRPWGDRRRFTRREQALLNLLHRATAELLEPVAQSLLDQRASTLSPRLKETLGFLLTSLSEKEIAFRMGVSNHTIHGYVKQIYVHLSVESRAELMAKFIKQSGASTANYPGT